MPRLAKILKIWHLEPLQITDGNAHTIIAYSIINIPSRNRLEYMYIRIYGIVWYQLTSKLILFGRVHLGFYFLEKTKKLKWIKEYKFAKQENSTFWCGWNNCSELFRLLNSSDWIQLNDGKYWKIFINFFADWIF